MNNKRLRVLVTLLATMALGSILFAACSRPGTPTASTGSSGGSTSATTTPSSGSGGGSSSSSSSSSNNCPNGTAHMVATNFAQNCVNVSKGSMLNLVDNGSYVHILANGTWVNGTPEPANEAGAPTISNLQFNGGSKQVGPFNTAGTYHIYCIIHTGMNLTVNVS